MQLRICFVVGGLFFREGNVDEDGFSRSLISGEPMMKNILGLHHWADRFNLSYLYLQVKSVRQENAVDKVDDCVAALQSGRADIISDMIQFPVTDDNVTQTVPTIEFAPGFLSTYETTSAYTVAPDLMDFWVSLPMEWYISSSLLFMALFYLASLVTSRQPTVKEIRKVSRKQVGHMTWLMISYIICYFGTPVPIATKRRKTAKVLYLVLVLISLVYKNHIGMITNTETTLRNLPEKIHTLRQAKDHGMIMAFTSKQDIKLCRGTTNAEIRELMEITMKKSTSEYLFDYINSDEGDRLERSREGIQGFLKRKHVFVGTFIVELFRYMCTLAIMTDIDFGHDAMIANKIDDPPSFLSGTVFNNEFMRRHPMITRKLIRNIRASVVECQPVLGYMRIMNDIQTAQMKSILNMTEFRQCVSRLDNPELSSSVFTPNIVQMKKLIIIMTMAYTVTLLVILLYNRHQIWQTFSELIQDSWHTLRSILARTKLLIYHLLSKHFGCFTRGNRVHVE
jgi:hypothetical protein